MSGNISNYGDNTRMIGEASQMKFETKLRKGHDLKTSSVALKTFEKPKGVLGAALSALRGRVLVKSTSGNEYVVKTSQIAKHLGISRLEARSIAKKGTEALATAVEFKARKDLANKELYTAISSNRPYSRDQLMKDSPGILEEHEWKEVITNFAKEIYSKNQVPEKFPSQEEFIKNVYPGNEALQSDLRMTLAFRSVKL